MCVRRYPSDLSDEQWALASPCIPPAKSGGRPRTTETRAAFDAILYLLRTGCRWRQVPADFPRWQTVHCYFPAGEFVGGGAFLEDKRHFCSRWGGLFGVWK
jgi:transposase